MAWEFPEYPDNWDEISRAARIRDGYTCQNCARQDQSLHVHHEIPLSKGGSSELSNLRTLCESCHSSQHPHMKQVYSGPGLRPKPYSPITFSFKFTYTLTSIMMALFVMIIMVIALGIICSAIGLITCIIVVYYIYNKEYQLYSIKREEYEMQMVEKRDLGRGLKERPFCPQCKSLMYPSKDIYHDSRGGVMICGNKRCRFQTEILE